MAFDDDWTDPTEEEEIPSRPSSAATARRRRRRRSRSTVPWWLVAIGGLVVVLAIVLLWTWALKAMEETKEPPTIAVTPTFTQAPSTATSAPAVVPTTPASPTDTPMPPTSTPMAEITVGGWVKVSNTGGAGLSFRAGPGQENARLKILTDGAVLKVLDGPREDAGFNWWRLEEYLDGQAGVIGWAVEDFLEPTSAP